MNMAKCEIGLYEHASFISLSSILVIALHKTVEDISEKLFTQIHSRYQYDFKI